MLFRSEIPDNPSMKNGVAGLLFILKQLTSCCDFLELKQKLSFRLTEFESSVDSTGYRQGAITPANCFGLLEGLPVLEYVIFIKGIIFDMPYLFFEIILKPNFILTFENY